MSNIVSAVIKSAPTATQPAAMPLTTRQRMANAASKRSVETAALPKVTVFAHNLPPETTVQDLRSVIGQCDRGLTCRLVMDKLTGSFKGTAFLEFCSAEAANEAIERAGRGAGLEIHGRRAQLAIAVSKEEARSIAAGKVSAPMAQHQDRRNLFLAREGEILDGSAAAVGVSAADMAKRRRAAEEKAAKLRNPNFSISRTRLSIRNLPASIGDQELKQLCVEAVQDRLGVRPAVQARILRDETRLDGSGAPRSRGMAFADMAVHEHALCVLRLLNNNPMVFGKERRPIVEFAISDARAARQHTLNVKRRGQRVASRVGELPAVQADDAPRKMSIR
jgi:nucleolar protein 4